MSTKTSHINIGEDFLQNHENQTSILFIINTISFDFASGTPVLYCSYGVNPIPVYNTPKKKCIPYHPLCGLTFTCIFDIDPRTGMTSIKSLTILFAIQVRLLDRLREFEGSRKNLKRIYTDYTAHTQSPHFIYCFCQEFKK